MVISIFIYLFIHPSIYLFVYLFPIWTMCVFDFFFSLVLCYFPFSFSLYRFNQLSMVDDRAITLLTVNELSNNHKWFFLFFFFFIQANKNATNDGKSQEIQSIHSTNRNNNNRKKSKHTNGVDKR